MCSVIYNTSFIDARQPYFLNMAVANSLVDLLLGWVDRKDLCIKWPNDILCRGKKISGILIENTVIGDRLKYSIVGIGLNLNQEDFPGLPGATSLKLETGKKVDRAEVLEALCLCLERRFLSLKSGHKQEAQELYNRNLYGIGEALQWDRKGNRFTGTPTGVDEAGRMLLQTEEGEAAFQHGEIILIKD